MRRTMKMLLSAFLAAVLFVSLMPVSSFAAETAGSGDVWWKYDSRSRTLYISDEENKGSDYAVYTAEEQRTVDPGSGQGLGWIGSCENALKVVIQGVPSPAETKFWFHRMSSLKSIENLDKLDTSKVTSMTWMFGVCYVLEEADVTGFDTSNVTDMSRMFYDCTALKSLDLSKFKTSKVTSMYAMFNTCNSLDTLGLAGLDTSQVTDMRNMFYYCSSLRSIDISSFDVSKADNMSWMFADCSALETIYAKSGTDWSGYPANMDNMFRACDSLKGGKGTMHSEAHYYKDYARIDDPDNGKPGYFTASGPDVPAVYTVSFNANGHGTAPADQTVNAGSCATEPDPAPSEAGWVFGGWYEDASCTGEPFDFSTPIGSDTELFAKWTEESPDPGPDPDDDDPISPVTGDGNRMYMLAAEAALLLGAIVTAVFRRKKTK